MTSFAGVDTSRARIMADCERAETRDHIYLQLDKLIALCTLQSMLDSGECLAPSLNRGSLSLLLEEQARELRLLLDAAFDETFDETFDDT